MSCGCFSQTSSALLELELELEQLPAAHPLYLGLVSVYLSHRLSALDSWIQVADLDCLLA